MDYENQKMLETMFNVRQTHRLLRREMFNDPGVTKAIAQSQLDEEFALDLLGQMALHKRATVPTVVGLLERHSRHSAIRCRCVPTTWSWQPSMTGRLRPAG